MEARASSPVQLLEKIYHPFHSRFQPARARTPTPHEPRFIHWFPVSLVGKIWA